MDWFKKKDKKEDGKQDEGQAAEAKKQLSVSEIDPKYAASARTRAVKAAGGMIYYKRAEKNEDGTWSVYRVEIVDTAQLDGKYKASFKPEAEETAPPAEDDEAQADVTTTEETTTQRKMAVRVYKESYSEVLNLKIDGEDETKMSFVKAMVLLANLERNVLLDVGGYEYVDAYDMSEADIRAKKAFCEIDEDSAFAQTNFHDIEHFVTVTEREGIAWAVDGSPKVMTNGRLVETGTYMVDDVDRANEARLNTIQNPPADENLPDILNKAFNGFSEKGNLDERLKAAKLISKMDGAFEALKYVQNTLKEMFDEGKDLRFRPEIDDYDRVMSAARDKFDEANELTDAFVGRIKRKLFFVDIIVYAAKAAEYLEKINNDDEKAGFYVDRIKDLQTKLEASAAQNGFGEELVNKAKNALQRGANGAVSILVFDDLIAEYDKNRQEYKEKLTKDPSAAAEQGNVALTRKRSGGAGFGGGK